MWNYIQKPLQWIVEWIENLLGMSPETLGKVLSTVVIVLGYLALTRLARPVLLQKIHDPARRYRLSKVLGYVAKVLTGLLVAKVWLLDTVNLTTYLGFLSAGLAIALKDPVANIAGWMFIVLRLPFRVGDRIEIAGHVGDVVDIRMFTFTMLEVGKWVEADQSTGRMVHLPNGLVFSHPCASYTHGFDFVWNEIPVIITFESDWERAHAVLTEIVTSEGEKYVIEARNQVHQVSEEYKVSYRHLTPIVWVKVINYGVELTMRYICNARQRRSTEDTLWRLILKRFKSEEDIALAYPTRRVFNGREEGKHMRQLPSPEGPSPEDTKS